jgi:protein SCO1/2
MPGGRNEFANLIARAAVALTGSSGTAPPPPDISSSDCVRPRSGPKSDYFPNVVVVTHEGQKALFYDDLLRGKTVMVNFMSIKGDQVHRTTENLAKVQLFLGDRLGRDVFIYSITVDPEHDTPRALSALAEKYSAGPGWLFLTGEPGAIQALRDRFFAPGAGHEHGNDPIEDCSMGLIRYGNEAAGLWGSVPGIADPKWIAQRFSWIETRQPPVGQPRRRGPAPLGTAKPRSQDED